MISWLVTLTWRSFYTPIAPFAAGSTTPELLSGLKTAITQGGIRWHAGAFNVQSETAELSHLTSSFNIAHDLDDAFGL